MSVTNMASWKNLAPGQLQMEGTEFTITQEADGAFALRYKGKPFAGTQTLAFAKMRIVDHIEDCEELGIEPGTPNGTVSVYWK